MELHTVGVNGGYTQHDVTEVAKVFTGWTVGSSARTRTGAPDRNGIPAQAEFDESKHRARDQDRPWRHRQGEAARREGLQVLHILATSPQTARFISTKLAIRFVSDDPPRALIDRMTQTFLATHGDIRKVLLSMVNSPEFFTPATYRAKVKTPQDFVISAVRASGADIESAAALANVIGELGMPVYGMQTPNGYSMKADPWNSSASLIARLNFALALSANRVVGVKTDWSAFLNSKPGRSSSFHKPAGTPHSRTTVRRRLPSLQRRKSAPSKLAFCTSTSAIAPAPPSSPRSPLTPPSRPLACSRSPSRTASVTLLPR